MFKMARNKKPKLATPDWILEGYDSEEDYNKAKGIKMAKPEKIISKKDSGKVNKTGKKSDKTFSVRVCPKCESDEVNVVVGEDAKGEWKCKKCKWQGREVKKQELNEEEFMEYLDRKHMDLPSENELKGDFKKEIEASMEDEDD